MERIQKFIQNLIMPVLLVATTFLGIFNTIQSNKLDLKSKEIKFTIDSLAFIDKQKEIDRKDLEFVRELKFKLFEEVKDAIKSNNGQLQKTVYEFVTQMIADDESFRNALLKSLENSQNVNEEVREKISQNFRNQLVFKAQEITKSQEEAPALTQQAKARVDIFYLEENQAVSKPLAEKIKEKIDNTRNYTVRLRILPKLTNTQTGYMIYGNEIRFQDNEKKMADIISQLINPLLREPINQKQIYYKKSSRGVDNYVSVFVKGE